MKLKIALLGTVMLMTGLSENLAYAQAVEDEVISTGTRTTSTYDPYDYGYPLPLGYDEKCGSYDLEDCYGDDGGGDDGGEGSTNTGGIEDVILVTGQRQRRFNLVVYVLAQVRVHFPEIFGGGNANSVDMCAVSNTPNDLSIVDLQDSYADFNPNGLNQLEVAIGGMIHSGAIADMAWNAHRVSEQLYPNDPVTRDAFRHVYWSYSLTSVFGSQLAEAFTNSHEVTGNNNNQPIGELYMDLYNNMVGRILFEIHGDFNFAGQNVQNLIIDAINNNQVITQVPQETCVQ